MIGANQRGEAIALVWNGTTNSRVTTKIINEALAEAKKLGLKTPLRIYGTTCAVSETRSFRFCQIPDEILASLVSAVRSRTSYGIDARVGPAGVSVRFLTSRPRPRRSCRRRLTNGQRVRPGRRSPDRPDADPVLRPSQGRDGRRARRRSSPRSSATWRTRWCCGRRCPPPSSTRRIATSVADTARCFRPAPRSCESDRARASGSRSSKPTTGMTIWVTTVGSWNEAEAAEAGGTRRRSAQHAPAAERLGR